MCSSKRLDPTKYTGEGGLAQLQIDRGSIEGMNLGRKLMKSGRKGYCYRMGFFSGLKSVIVEDVCVHFKIRSRRERKGITK